MEEDEAAKRHQQHEQVAALSKRAWLESDDPTPPPKVDVDMESPPKRAKVPGWSGDGSDLQSLSLRASAKKRVRPIDIENVESNMERLHIRRRCSEA